MLMKDKKYDSQQSPTFLALGTDFMEDNFSVGLLGAVLQPVS